MNRTIYLNQKRVNLKPAQLIQSGGEGMVFDLGQTAVKLYHTPLPQHAAKLRDWLDGGFNQRLPAAILGPCALAMDGQQRVLGFQMPKLPADTRPLKQLSSPVFWRQNNLKTGDAAQLFLDIHATLRRLHQSGVIVGDLNDRNLFFTFSPPHAFSAAWIDVDSYQFNGRPCPVASPPFLDPRLYTVADFSQRPVFSPETDWYAYFVLLVKSLLQVHPYGGVHRQLKTLEARAKANVSILHADVKYPQMARPLPTLSDDLLHHLHLVFNQGQRPPFPAALLQRYQASLISCADCGLAYPSERHACPACRQLMARRQPVGAGGKPQVLLDVDGFIEQVGLRPDGRFHVIVRAGHQFRLIRAGVGGVLDEVALFTGRLGYRFSLFGQFVAVNPPGSRQILLLDVSGRQPQQAAMLETELFRDTAVFAATPRHLYRIAGTWIMRGRVQNGLYVEDAIATAHRRQTMFCASPHADLIAGVHRVFAENRYFVVNKRGETLDLTLPPLLSGGSVMETAIAFDPNGLAFIRKIRGRRQERLDIAICAADGRFKRILSEAVDVDSPLPLALQPTMLCQPLAGLTAVSAIPHRTGLLVQEPTRLTLIPIS